jgi:hypothetical protein
MGMKQYLDNYLDDGAQQALVTVGVLTLLGAVVRHQQGKSYYASSGSEGGRLGSMASEWNSFVAKRVPELVSSGKTAPEAMQMAANEFHR